MPGLNSRLVFELTRSLKAFLNLEAGLTRGQVPLTADTRPLKEKTGRLQQRLAQKQKQLDQAQRQLAARDRQIKELRNSKPPTGASTRLVTPDRLVWIFCASRSGSTWLYNMLNEMGIYEAWHEPLVGSLFGDFYEKYSHRGGKHFILGGNKEHWQNPVRSFILEAATAKFPATLKGKYLAVKEPGSAVGAPIVMEALPESALLLLIRDPRDVAASSLDAHKKGSWFRERREQLPQERTAKRFANFDEDPDSHVQGTANNYLRQMSKAKEAYDNHGGPKVIVKYEDLVKDTLGVLKRAHAELGIPVDEGELARVVEKHSWHNIPEDKRGEGKFYRKGQPGSWREDLTPEQIEIVEKTTAPLLSVYYAE